MGGFKQDLNCWLISDRFRCELDWFICFWSQSRENPPQSKAVHDQCFHWCLCCKQTTWLRLRWPPMFPYSTDFTTVRETCRALEVLSSLRLGCFCFYCLNWGFYSKSKRKSFLLRVAPHLSLLINITAIYELKRPPCLLWSYTEWISRSHLNPVTPGLAPDHGPHLNSTSSLRQGCWEGFNCERAQTF